MASANREEAMENPVLNISGSTIRSVSSARSRYSSNRLTFSAGDSQTNSVCISVMFNPDIVEAPVESVCSPLP